MFIVTVSVIHCWLGYVPQPITTQLAVIYTAPRQVYLQRQREHQRTPNDVYKALHNRRHGRYLTSIIYYRRTAQVSIDSAAESVI